MPEHQRRTRDFDPRQRPADDAGLAVPGAFFAVLAALAGIAAHGLASPASLQHAPSFDAIFLLTAGAAALGAGAALLVGVVRRLAFGLSAPLGRVLAVAANPRALGLLLPVTVGQWFAHSVLEADHMLSAGGAGAAAGTGGAHAGHAGHGVDAAAVSGGLAGGSAHHSGGAEMVLPMLAAHLIGVVACLAVSIIVRRALGRLVGRVSAAISRPVVTVAARVMPGSGVIRGGGRGFAPAAPRAPPVRLALAA